MTTIFLLAGEHSGDVLGARLIEAVRRRRPDIDFVGIGGPRMIELGFSSLFPMAELAVMGLVEILPRLRRLRARLQQTVAAIAACEPDLVVTIDSPGFALPVLRRIAPSGVKRIHYVAPQVWAWREHRVKRFPGLWDRLLCLLPFEPEWFGARGVPATFVGHPVLESGAGQGDAARFRARHDVARDAPVVVLMPGSRSSEVGRLLPVFGATLERLAVASPGLVAVVPSAGAVAATVARLTASWRVRPVVIGEVGDKHDAYAAAGAALTKSGTSTLELALAGVPMAVTYRVNRVSAAIARRLIRVPHVAMVNLLAEQAVVPELLQEDCTPANLAAVLAELLGGGALAASQRAAFPSILEKLRPPGRVPSDSAAEAVLELLDQA